MIAVLFVDDDPVLLGPVKEYLERTGTFTVDIVATASEAVSLPRFAQYDSLVSEYLLPGMDGIAFLRQVRSTGNRVPFILFTGQGSEDAAMEALNEGANFYLKKDADTDTMAVDLARVIPMVVERCRDRNPGEIPGHDEMGKADSFRELFSNMRSGAAIYVAVDNGTDFVFRDFNRAAEAIENIRREEVIGRRITEVFPAIVEFGLLEVLMRVSRTGIPEHHPITLYHDNRIAGWRENFVYRLSNGEIVALYDDITEKKKAEDTIRESLERYQLILKNANEGIMVNELSAGKPGRFIEVNESALRILGIGRDAIQDTCLADLGTPELRARYAEFSRIMSMNGHVSFRTEYQTSDGTKKFLAISSSQFVLSGRPAILSVVRDITDQKTTELALMHANKKLNLLTGITRHDIKNQLLTLNAYLVLAREPRGDPEKRRELLKNAGEITKNIERQILFTREYEKLGTTVPEWRDLQESIRHSAAELDLTGIDLVTNNLDDLEIFSDNLLQKVFFNLLDNSLRHGGTEMTQIRFSCHESGSRLEILYEDDGLGIFDDEKDKIFERGYGKNTGFGLFFIREILAITAITIREDGEPGTGARFVITVPAGAWRIPASCLQPGSAG